MSLSSSVGEMSAPLLRASLLLAMMVLPAAASAQQRPAAQGASVQAAPGQGLRVVARVNDDAITDFDLSQRVLFAIRTSGLADSPDLRQRMAGQMLRQMIDERLQVQDAKKLGVRPTESEINSRYTEIERAAGLGQGQFKLYLQSVGVAPDIAKQQIEAQIAWGKIIRRKVRSQVDVSDAEIDDAMSRMRTNVGKTETRVAEIFVPVDRADGVDEGKRSADRIMEQLRRGAPFAAVAQQFSQGRFCRIRRRSGLGPARRPRSFPRGRDRTRAAAQLFGAGAVGLRLAHSLRRLIADLSLPPVPTTSSSTSSR